MRRVKGARAQRVQRAAGKAGSILKLPKDDEKGAVGQSESWSQRREEPGGLSWLGVDSADGRAGGREQWSRGGLAGVALEEGLFEPEEGAGMQIRGEEI